MTSESDGTRSSPHGLEFDAGTPASTATDELTTRLRQLPGIDALLEEASAQIDRFGRDTVVQALRAAVDRARADVRAGGEVPAAAALLDDATARMQRRRPANLAPVINATGVVVHTNLGRAPLAPAAREAMLAAAGYCDLEYDLASGQRGSRTARLEPLLCDATGAEAAFVVNNAAAALVLALAALASGREVMVSRGELIEIGGSFRLPDIMAASGAHLLEVGTTNRTRAADYMGGTDPAAILALHPSNYRIVGFVEQPTLSDLAKVAATRGVPLLFDAGSGLLQPTGGALAAEPSVAGSLNAGADVVLCSGDKLLGGPQAGVLVGRADLVTACRRHPLARALRLDKLRIAALHATLDLHLRDQRDAVPVRRMVTADDDALAPRCRRLIEALTAAGLQAAVGRAAGLPGGGAAPDATLAGPVVTLDVDRPSAVARRLRAVRPPLIVRIVDDAIVVDLRTVDEADDEIVAAHLRAVCERTPR